MKSDIVRQSILIQEPNVLEEVTSPIKTANYNSPSTEDDEFQEDEVVVEIEE